MNTIKPTVVERIDKNHADHRIGDMTEINRFSHSELQQLKIIHHGMTNKTVLNHFRELRTNILSSVNQENFCALVTSVTEGGGASHVCANLSAVFSLDHTKSSLLIDCNLDSPNVNRLLAGSADMGLTDYLIDPSINISDIVQASGIPRLRIIPLGQHLESAAEYFSSERMKAFIGEVKSRYPDRFVFIDAPPIATAEARILAQLTDFSLLVVPYGKVTKTMISQAADAIGEEKLMGMVFNN